MEKTSREYAEKLAVLKKDEFGLYINASNYAECRANAVIFNVILSKNKSITALKKSKEI